VRAIDAPGPASGMVLRRAAASDVLCLSVLGMQVFLDTYATDGIRAPIAREVLQTFSQPAFERSLQEPTAQLWVAEVGVHLIGYAHVTLVATHPLAPAGVQAELLRLYVQEPFTARRVGSALLAAAEASAAAAGATVLWLTPYVGNHRARAFYLRRGYADFGSTPFVFEGETHENRLYAKAIGTGAEPAADGQTKQRISASP
jgi:diamine N-acetyltransferase